MAKGLSAARVAIADAQRDLAKRNRRRNDPLPHMPRGPASDIRPGQWTPDLLGLPKEDPCPVTPLGFEPGLYHVVDSSGVFRSLASSDFTHSGMQDLFGEAPNWPQWAFPRYGRAPKVEDGEPQPPPPIKSFDDDAVREALFLACRRKGLFSPTDKMRGRGGWTLRGGQLVYHAGEELWIYEGGRLKVMDTGFHDGQLYPRLAPLPAPWPEPIGNDDNPCRALIEIFRQWNWERPEVDPVLVLGWIGVALLGGALDWRPAICLLGGFGTGKSSLHDGLKALFGEALFHTADTTAAGIYQAMGHDARPVAVDELEADADMRKVQAVVNLMRAAASGAFARRGGSDHHAVEFTMHSAFLFSAINNPLQASQDLSRVAILRLRELKEGKTEPPVIDGDTTGRMVLAQLMREWHRFEETRRAYMEALAGGGHVARGQRTYGTLLACADLLLGPELMSELELPVDDLSRWGELLSIAMLPEVEDAVPNWHACMSHLLTARVPNWRQGRRATIGHLIDALVVGGQDGGIALGEAQEELAQAGLGLVDTSAKGAPAAAAIDLSKLRLPAEGPWARDRYWLAIPNRSQLLNELFAGTAWESTPGQSGRWKDALRQAPDGMVVTDKGVNRQRINGNQERCTLVRLSAYHAATER